MIVSTLVPLLRFSFCIPMFSLLVFQLFGCSVSAGESPLVQKSESDEDACYLALNTLKQSQQNKEDIAFYFGYLSGTLRVALPNRWKLAFQGIPPRDWPTEEFPSNRVFEGEVELSDSDIEKRGISSLVSRLEARCVLVTPDKHKDSVIYTTSFTNFTRSFDVKCIDRDTKSILWTQKILSHLRGGNGTGYDWNYVDLVSTTESIFVFGMSSSFCYIERLDARSGQTTLTFYSAPMDFPNWENHRVLPQLIKDRDKIEKPTRSALEKHNVPPK